MLHVNPMWPAWVCTTSQTRAIKQRNVVHVHQSYYKCGSGYLQWIFSDRRFLGLKIPAHDCHSGDHVLAPNNSDSDILATVEKAGFVEFLDDDS